MQSVTEVEEEWSKKPKRINVLKDLAVSSTKAPISSIALRPLGAAYIPILLNEVEQEQSGNGDREAIVVAVGLCDREGERVYTVYDPILGGEIYLNYFKRLYTLCRCKNLFAGALITEKKKHKLVKGG